MKKIFLLVGGLLSLAMAFGQQRLAILGEAAEGIASSVCIDYFRDAPSSETGAYLYHSDASLNGTTLTPQGYDKVTVTRDGTPHSLSPTDPLYLSHSDDLGGISAQKKSFIKSQYDRLKALGPITDGNLAAAQGKIWAFDVLEHLGYLDRDLSAQEAYKRGLQAFGRDFLDATERPDEQTVLEVAEVFKILFGHNSSGQPAFYFVKNQSTGEVVAFNSIAPPVYRGSSAGDLSRTVNGVTANGQMVWTVTDGFGDESKGEAFLLNLKRRLSVNYNKDLVFSTYPDNPTWSREYLTIKRAFDPSAVRDLTLDGAPAVAGSMRIRNNEGTAITLEGISNSRSVLSSFFTRLSTRVRNSVNGFILGRACSTIRSQVLTEMRASGNNYFLDVLISREGGAKDVVRIDLNNVQQAGHDRQ